MRRSLSDPTLRASLEAATPLAADEQEEPARCPASPMQAAAAERWPSCKQLRTARRGARPSEVMFLTSRSTWASCPVFEAAPCRVGRLQTVEGRVCKPESANNLSFSKHPVPSLDYPDLVLALVLSSRHGMRWSSRRRFRLRMLVPAMMLSMLRVGSWGACGRRGPVTADLSERSLFGRLTGCNSKLSRRPLDRDSACGQMGLRPSTVVDSLGLPAR